MFPEFTEVDIDNRPRRQIHINPKQVVDVIAPPSEDPESQTGMLFTIINTVSGSRKVEGARYDVLRKLEGRGA